MARWLARLSGERTDLEEFSRRFPDGEVYAIEENRGFYLVGPAFEVLPDAEAVLAKATRTLESLTAVISLIDPDIERPTVDAVVREAEGRRQWFKLESGALSLRAKVSASGSATQGPRRQTQAQELLNRAARSPHLNDALDVWGDPVKSWPRLYRILEEIEQHLGKHVNEAGLCSDNQRRRFAQSAQAPESAGMDSRHASKKKFKPPADPMPFKEAKDFVRRLLLRVLQ